MPVIDADGLTKRYGDVAAVNELSLSVGDGQLFGFIGPNGAGKTTTINMLTGQMTPDRGQASVLGIDPAARPKALRKEIGILPEQEDPPSFLTPREYFDFVADIRDLDEVEQQVERWADRLLFQDRLDTLCKDLSKGEKQKVMIAQTFLHEPRLVFIDEPLINLDPIIQEAVKAFFVDYREQGNTIFLSTHVLSLADDICTHVGIIDDGELIAAGEKDGVVGENDSLLDAFIARVNQYETAARDA